jgi:hypothetical protein
MHRVQARTLDGDMIRKKSFDLPRTGHPSRPAESPFNRPLLCKSRGRHQVVALKAREGALLNKSNNPLQLPVYPKLLSLRRHQLHHVTHEPPHVS